MSEHERCKTGCCKQSNVANTKKCYKNTCVFYIEKFNKQKFLVNFFLSFNSQILKRKQKVCIEKALPVCITYLIKNK